MSLGNARKKTLGYTLSWSLVAVNRLLDLHDVGRLKFRDDLTGV